MYILIWMYKLIIYSRNVSALTGVREIHEKITLYNLKPSTKKISLRLPEIMIEELKVLANKRDVPYQSLMKIFLAERIAKEFGTHGH
jgi:predicted DNA binding CopG/RHH family protein